MLKATKDKAPKLKSNAAECRGLMPIAHKMAQDLLSRDDPFELTVLTATEHLWGCYQCLSSDQDEGARMWSSHCSQPAGETPEKAMKGRYKSGRAAAASITSVRTRS